MSCRVRIMEQNCRTISLFNFSQFILWKILLWRPLENIFNRIPLERSIKMLKNSRCRECGHCDRLTECVPSRLLYHFPFSMEFPLALLSQVPSSSPPYLSPLLLNILVF